MTKTFTLAPKRGEYVDVTDLWAQEKYQLPAADLARLEKLDAAYRALVAVLYNFVPTSGHPGEHFLGAYCQFVVV